MIKAKDSHKIMFLNRLRNKAFLKIQSQFVKVVKVMYNSFLTNKSRSKLQTRYHTTFVNLYLILRENLSENA